MLNPMKSRYNANRKKLYVRGSLQPRRYPATTIDKQFTIMKMKPIRIDGVIDTGDMVDLPSSYCKFRNPKPVPINKLKDGPAKHPVVAMSGIPFLAMARFAERSPMLLPHDRTVRPRIVDGILLIVPANWSNPTRASAILSIHVAAMKNPYRDTGIFH
jgi:hypothetical protein